VTAPSSVRASGYRNPDADPNDPWISVDLTAPGSRPNLEFEIRGRRPPEGRRWKFSAERVAELEEQGRILLSPNGQPRLKRYLSEVAQQAKHAEPTDPAAGRLELIIRPAMQALARALSKNPALLAQVEWRDLERVMREVFEGLGFETLLTRPAKDGGYDLEIVCDEDGRRTRYLVELKHWPSGKRTGKGVYSAFVEVVVRSLDARGGLLLSSSGFTGGLLHGRTEIEQQMIRIGGTKKIVSLCDHYVMRVAGVWQPVASLPELLFADTD
jgi:hypothetical protein